MTSAKSVGGKANELLCNEPPCNVRNGAITLRCVCGAIQCMNAAEYDTILHHACVCHP